MQFNPPEVQMKLQPKEAVIIDRIRRCVKRSRVIVWASDGLVRDFQVLERDRPPRTQTQHPVKEIAHPGNSGT